MRHLQLQGSHYEMGVRRGEILRENKVTFPIHLDEFQMQHGKQSSEILRTVFPEVCEEVRGLTNTIDVDFQTFLSWMLCMGCCMYNLAGNIPKEIRGCTAFAYSGNGQVIYGRNNDLPPWMREQSNSEVYDPEGGYRFQLTTSSFINGEEGINEHGLAAAMTFVMTRLHKIRPGINSCFAVRYLLEKAKNTKEALTLLQNLPVASNYNLLIADPGGDMAVVECTPSGKRIRNAEPVQEGSLICIVNSFTSEEMKAQDDSEGQDYRSRERYEVVRQSFAKRKDRTDVIGFAQKLLRGEYGFLCQYDQEPDFETIWSSVFDLKTRMIYRAEGDPRRHEFQMDPRLRELIEKEK